MKTVFISIFFLAMSLSPSFSAETIKIAAPGDKNKFLCPVITKDGSGVYNQIYDQVFRFENIKVVFEGMPVIRCKSNVKNGKADAFPGGVVGEKYKDYTFHNPKTAIFYSEGIAVHYKKTTIRSWKGPESLKGKSILYVRGTDHINELKKHGDLLKNEYETAYASPTPLGALKMLNIDRADVLIISAELLLTAQVEWR